MAELHALIRVIESRQKFHTPDHITIGPKKIDFSQTFWENRSSGPQSDSTEGFVCRAAGRRTMNLRTCRIFRVSSPDDEHFSVTALGLSHHLSRTAAAITAGLEVETAAATAIPAPIPAR